MIALGFLQLFAALLYWSAGRGRGWPAAAALVLVVAEVAQAAFGFSAVAGTTRALVVHIPLGVAIVAGAIAFTGWVLLTARWAHPSGDWCGFATRCG